MRRYYPGAAALTRSSGANFRPGYPAWCFRRNGLAVGLSFVDYRPVCLGTAGRGHPGHMTQSNETLGVAAGLRRVLVLLGVVGGVLVLAWVALWLAMHL